MRDYHFQSRNGSFPKKGKREACFRDEVTRGITSRFFLSYGHLVALRPRNPSFHSWNRKTPRGIAKRLCGTSIPVSMGHRKTVSNPASTPSDPMIAHIPTPGASHPSPPPGDTLSPTPGDVNVLTTLLEGGGTSRAGSTRCSPTPANPVPVGGGDPALPDTRVSTPCIPALDKGKGRAPPSRSLSPIREAGGPVDAVDSAFPGRARSVSTPPGLQAPPRGLVHPTPGPSWMAATSGPAARDRVPQLLGKRPALILDTDEDSAPDHIVLTAAELQAIIQEHMQRLQPPTALVTPAGMFPYYSLRLVRLTSPSCSSTSWHGGRCCL